jgi:UDP-N-acetylmuramoylalanine--D-glutamate ligase
MEALVVGLAVTGEAVARQLLRRGHGVVVVDDRPSDAVRARADALEVELVEAPGVAALESLIKAADVVLPSPGVRASHPCFALADGYGIAVWSEFELAAQWAPSVPLAAVTGTNGKTTVVTLVTDMLVASGVPSVAAGNTDLPLVDAIDSAAEVIVVEASSFRLMHAPSFRPAVAAWLNLADDHLDWHPDMAHYAAAKARIWANQSGDDLAIANADDPIVMAALAGTGGRRETFGLDQADWRWDRATDVLTGPAGDIVAVSALPRSRPHDLANALAASAVALAAGASVDACAAVLRDFRGLPHRVELVRDAGGVEYYDDSKATTPASVVAAVSGFDSVVLIAGGRSKSSLASLADVTGHLRAVVAIGDAAGEVEAVFANARPVERAGSMDEAVAAAARLARPGDAVLLSPGCASFDWYRNYGERGDDFARAVNELVT